MTKITTHEVRLNGQRRWHFVCPNGSKSLRTWTSKRNAMEAGRREFALVK